METTVIYNILLAAVGGILPALIWLFFWLKEDRLHPEPKHLIVLAFVTGMCLVLPILTIESWIFSRIASETGRLIFWSIIEEAGKFLAAYIILLHRKEIDEPIDYVMYMVTIALGFAAVENALFIFNPLSKGLMAASIITGNLRFIGATLLHVSASATVGIAMAFSFYKNRMHKWKYTLVGLILAIALHTAFNLSIIIGGGKNSLMVAAVVWVAVISVLLLLEKIKKVHPTSN